MRSSEFETMHEQLGCATCRYADTGALGKRPCCTRMRGPDPDTTGKCRACCGNTITTYHSDTCGNVTVPE